MADKVGINPVFRNRFHRIKATREYDFFNNKTSKNRIYGFSFAYVFLLGAEHMDPSHY
jgi:hypothetical protein